MSRTGNYTGGLCSLPTKSETKAIKKAVKLLPPTFSKTLTEKRVLYGSQLNAMGQKQTDGKPFKADKQYITNAAKRTDHFAEALRCFSEGGMPKVLRYCDQILKVGENFTEYLKNKTLEKQAVTK